MIGFSLFDVACVLRINQNALSKGLGDEQVLCRYESVVGIVYFIFLWLATRSCSLYIYNKFQKSKLGLLRRHGRSSFRSWHVEVRVRRR